MFLKGEGDMLVMEYCFVFLFFMIGLGIIHSFESWFGGLIPIFYNKASKSGRILCRRCNLLHVNVIIMEVEMKVNVKFLLTRGRVFLTSLDIFRL